MICTKFQILRFLFQNHLYLFPTSTISSLFSHLSITLYKIIPPSNQYTNLLLHLILRTVPKGIIFLVLLIGNPQLSQIPPFIGFPHLGQITAISSFQNPLYSHVLNT